MRIAVLDNDRSQADLVCQVLSAAGHSCQFFDSAKEMLAQLRKDSTDLLIMDWPAGDLEAADTLRRAKEKMAPDAPAMFLVSGSAEDDIVAGMAAGADDYLVKPLRRGELVARVSALLRRAYPAQTGTEQLQFGSYIFETRPGRLIKDGSIIDVTQKEFIWPCCSSATSAARCRARISTKPSGSAKRRCPRARWTPTSRACATS